MSTHITQQSIEHDLKQIGLEQGDIVNVHSSMKSIGPSVEGGPQAVIQALLNAIGETGTLLMPVFCLPDTDIDLNTIPSRLGLITETFRCWPGVKRSNDPTHSVSGIGQQADKILSDHELVPPLGINSPLHKAALLGGKTLHLGTDLRSCSLIHVAESIAQAPYLHIGYPGYHKTHNYTCTDGEQRTKIPSEAPGDSRGFLVIHDHPDITAARTSGPIGQAPSELYDSEKLLNATAEILKVDPYIILCDSEKCSVCQQRKAIKD